jgi:hypothetical protein
MLCNYETARLSSLEEFRELTEETPSNKTPEPKLSQYRNSVWEGKSSPNEYSLTNFLEVERERTRNDELETGAATISSSGLARDILDINWANLKDWIRNWRVIPLNERLLLKALITSPLQKNGNRYALKQKNLGSHLLQCIGVDMTNIIGNGVCAVRSNLVDETGRYHNDCANNRALDPKTCRRAFAYFLKDYNIPLLYKKGYVSFHTVVNSSRDLRKVDRETECYKKKIWKFYKENSDAFRWLRRKKICQHIIYVHEISTQSILERELNPHTHVMFFFKDPKCGPEELQWMARKIVGEFNERFTDRAMSPDTEMNEDDAREVRIQTRWNSATERSIGYYFRVASTVRNYLSEITPENIRELNKATQENWRDVKYLMSGKGQRRFKILTTHEFKKPSKS